MVILALDTTTPAGSVALVRDGKLLASQEGDPSRTHGERLPGDVIAVLKMNGMTLGDVELYAVCSGPGSFTGLRVGIATIQALALANERVVVAVPALEALSYAAIWASTPAKRTGCVGGWMSAHRGEVFAALYEMPPTALSETRSAAHPDVGSDPTLVERVGPLVGVPESIIERWGASLDGCTLTVTGDAVRTSRALLEQRLGDRLCLVETVFPLAPILARVAAARARRNTAVAPHALRPVYVRRPDAELARERRRADQTTRPHGQQKRSRGSSSE